MYSDWSWCCDESCRHFCHLVLGFHRWFPLNTPLPVVCACACVRAGKERKKPDRVVFDCQERAYWMVNRPPVSLSNSVLSTCFILFSFIIMICNCIIYTVFILNMCSVCPALCSQCHGLWSRQAHWPKHRWGKRSVNIETHKQLWSHDCVTSLY